ncbi:MAG: helix-turn-helix transcriptional regulator, partial [Myxococcales bacterium]|nr:helix-turn-helix transcriptional regulator [Myxococcales bacterium]
ILDAAADAFGERGFEGASYNRIIERAGISKGAMYYYFADKDDLFRTVLEAASTQWLAEVGFPVGADDAASFWKACETMYVRSLRFVLRDPRNAALCVGITKARAELANHPAVQLLNERMLEWVGALVGHGQAIGAVREDVPTELLVHSALSLIDAGDRWLAPRWATFGEGDVETTAAMMVDFLRRIAAPEVTP